MREWLPEDDLVFVILDAVATVDLGEFYRCFRADRHGRAAFDPEMMVALLLYGYCQSERSSRVIKRRCVRDVGYRVITGGPGGHYPTPPARRAYHRPARFVRLSAWEPLFEQDKAQLSGTGRAPCARFKTVSHRLDAVRMFIFILSIRFAR